MPSITDPRRVVGGACWAKSTSVSNDSRRIYGVEAPKIWLKGTVLEVLSIRAEGAQRASTWIRARYTVGTTEKIKDLSLAQLKKENPEAEEAAPRAPPPAAPPAAQVAAAPTSLQNSEQSSAENGTSPPTAPAATVPGTGQTETTAGSSVRVPITIAHNREWFEGDTELPTNGPFTYKTWKFTCQYTGQEFTPGCDPGKETKAFDFFMTVFPASQLRLMVDETSTKLAASGQPKTTKGEILKWLGILLLITRFEFGNRRDLWAEKSSSKYVPAPAFGRRTGMARDCFEALLCHCIWSQQPAVRPKGMSHEAY